MSEARVTGTPSPVPGERPRRRKNTRGRRTRQDLLDAAVACFSEYGYARTRIADIVFRAGVSQGNFYRHFTSKDEIFLEALRPSLDELTASTARSGHRVGADHAALVVLIGAYLTTYARHRRILRVMREAAATSADEGFTELWLQQRSSYVERTARWLREMQERDRLVLEDLELLADVLGSALEQTAYVHIGLSVETPRHERVEELARTVATVWHRTLAVHGSPAA